jgi:hypothetical protein
MKTRDDILLEQAYRSIYLQENATTLEDILPALQWKQTTKQPHRYEYAQDVNNMSPMSYAVAKEQQTIVTHTADGKETQNVAAPDDVVMSGPSGEQYVVKAAKFPKLYAGKIGGVVTPEQSPRTEARVNMIDQPIMFKAPWGEDMVLKPGDYLVKDGDQGYYRIAQLEYDKTYNKI